MRVFNHITLYSYTNVKSPFTSVLKVIFNGCFVKVRDISHAAIEVISFSGLNNDRVG